MAVGGTLLSEATLVGSMFATVGPSPSTNPSGSKVNGLKLEIPEKYIGS